MEKLRTGKLIVLACACLIIATASSCSRKASRAQTLAEFAATGKSPHETAQFVFENYECKSCHTLSKEGKFGFTSWGSQLRQQSEGCVALLTAMNVMIHVPETDWTSEERRKHAHFQEYGCTVCHQVTPGKMGLTETGEKLASLHLSCVEVQQILNQR